MKIIEWLNAVQDWETKLDNDEWVFVKLREVFVQSLSPEEAWTELEPIGRRILIESDQYLKGELGALMLSVAIHSKTTELPINLEVEFPKIISTLRDAGSHQVSDGISRWFRR